jgi:hypothetical protein
MDKFISRGHHNVLRKKHLLVACMPKSGSTFLTTILSNINDFRRVHLVPQYGYREQELDVLKLVLCDRYNYVAQHHVRSSQITQDLLKKFDVKLIVLVRNLYDITVSIRDHLRNESIIAPMGYVSPDMTSWSDEQLEEFIVDLIMPWYFNFYVGWQECSNKLILTYEELAATPGTVIEKINKHYNLGITDGEINIAIESAYSADTRKNVAKVGRGEHLSEYCKQRINHMAKYYTGIDFSLIGLYSG